MYRNVSKNEKCTNCCACLNVCPTEAVLVKDSDYFYSVFVNQEKCIGCGRCVSVCPTIYKVIDQTYTPLAVVAGRHKDKTVVSVSSSGGFFTAVADYVVKRGGNVYGAVFSKDYKKVVFGSTQNVDLDDIRRSKYTESLTDKTFLSVKNDVENGVYTLFCGTPCQVAGLKAFLGKEYDNLVTCDFICGGLASHKLYEEQLDLLEKKFGAKITSLNFRPKVLGWGEHTFTASFENGKRIDLPADLVPYFWAFLTKRAIKDGCDSCPFVGHKSADFTLADFWQYKRFLPKNNLQGLSLVGVNTEKASLILKELTDFEILVEDNLLINCFPKFKSEIDTKALRNRKKFFEDCTASGLEFAYKNAGGATGKSRLIATLKYKLKKTKYKLFDRK